jgi:hypothetical protein
MLFLQPGDISWERSCKRLLVHPIRPYSWQVQTHIRTRYRAHTDMHVHAWCHLPMKVYLITEMLTGGELLDAVLQRGSYNEGEARMCFVQLMRGIEYLHSR